MACLGLMNVDLRTFLEVALLGEFDAPLSAAKRESRSTDKAKQPGAFDRFK
jgi:hypothetical protein